MALIETILFLLLAVVVLVFQVLSGVRAYVGGEGLWSKGQKDAVYALNRYLDSRDPADFHRFEQAMIDTCADWNIEATRKEGAPGVYVNGAKIGALGIRVRNGRTFHGLAFNIAMDLEPFQRINPCGYQGLAVTSMLDLGGPSGIEGVKPALLEHVARLFGLNLQLAAVLPQQTQPAAAQG